MVKKIPKPVKKTIIPNRATIKKLPLSQKTNSLIEPIKNRIKTTPLQKNNNINNDEKAKDEKISTRRNIKKPIEIIEQKEAQIINKPPNNQPAKEQILKNSDLKSKNAQNVKKKTMIIPKPKEEIKLIPRTRLISNKKPKNSNNNEVIIISKTEETVILDNNEESQKKISSLNNSKSNNNPNNFNEKNKFSEEKKIKKKKSYLHSFRIEDDDDEGEEDNMLDQEYFVEEILDKKKMGKYYKYLIKWQGFPDEANTWEPKKYLPKLMIKEFEEKFIPNDEKVHENEKEFTVSKIENFPNSEQKTRGLTSISHENKQIKSIDLDFQKNEDIDEMINEDDENFKIKKKSAIEKLGNDEGVITASIIAVVNRSENLTENNIKMEKNIEIIEKENNFGSNQTINDTENNQQIDPKKDANVMEIEEIPELKFDNSDPKNIEPNNNIANDVGKNKVSENKDQEINDNEKKVKSKNNLATKTLQKKSKKVLVQTKKKEILNKKAQPKEIQEENSDNPKENENETMIINSDNEGPGSNRASKYGDFRLGDRFKKIQKMRYNRKMNEVYAIVEWKQRNDGFKPFTSKVHLEHLKTHIPNETINFLVNTLINLQEAKRKENK